jgi:hypothetical protein
MPRPISQLPAPSKTDLEILAVLWDRPSATGREIYDVLLDAGRLRRRIAYTTAAVSREAVRDHPDLLARLVRVFRLTPAEFIRWCHAHGQLRPQDHAALHTLLHDMSDQALPPTAQIGP